MANGLDRLERLFGKKKPAAASAEYRQPVHRPPTGVSEPQFPSPSFIRPKATRMSAREEVRVKQQPNSRVNSCVESHPPERKASIITDDSSSSADSYRPVFYSPVRLKSAGQWPEPLHLGIDEFIFPRPPTNHGERSPTSSISYVKSSFESTSQRSHRSYSPRKVNAAPPRLDTPPSSDPEEDDVSSQYFRNKKLPDLPVGAPPTPRPSPELRPALVPRLHGTKSTEVLNTSISNAPNSQPGESFDHQLRKALSQSSLVPSSSRSSVGSSTLREPDVHDFLGLSDDDIAEDHEEDSMSSSSQSASPAPSVLTPSVASSRNHSLLTLSPPFSSRPATAAAFEAARIAKRYNFDLVYVVNLWPDKKRSSTSSLGQEQRTSFDSRSSASSSAAMSGRLLAAYGLECVKSPFQISANVHGKILRSDGWIEYRNQEDCQDEFARGYACAFYTGRYSKKDSVHSNTSTTVKPGLVDRGIVFAAYRKPRDDGSLLGINSDKVELAKVYQDAEALVEMLIDVHSANKQRRPASHPQDADETGPMPVQRPFSR